MKKIYIIPTTQRIETDAFEMVCASKYMVKKYGAWGATEAQNQYGNDAWQIEGYISGAQQVGGFTAVDIEDDYGTLESRSNESLWE